MTKRFYYIFTCTLWLLLTLLVPSVGFSANQDNVDCSTLDGKIMCGYQGWFNCPGDGSKRGWVHWGRGRLDEGLGRVTFDIWPDMSDYEDDEKFETGFQHQDGRNAVVFSSANKKTVARHFEWMKEYGIDGAFVQRFATSLGSEAKLRNRDRILNHCREGAEQHGRAFVVMYDLSGMKRDSLGQVIEDWERLLADVKITSSKAYLHHHGKPLVAIWGVGFRDRHEDKNSYSLENCRDLIKAIKATGCRVMLGVPTGWRERHRDCVDDPAVDSILQLADVISPWTPGRYQTVQQAQEHGEKVWAADQTRCEELNQDYLPVVFPGFSWHNLRDGKAPLGQIPRLKGKFFWSQIVAAKKAGAKMIYVAMFDEVDEGTAIFKCTDDPPVGQGARFLGMEGLPSDFYLRLTGHAGKLLRDEVELTEELPNLIEPDK
ncbi:MAG: glycoside hydrolase family 71/99-like protein [Planctomycetota bacterium]